MQCETRCTENSAKQNPNPKEDCPCDSCKDREIVEALFGAKMYGDSCLLECMRYRQWEKKHLETQHDF